MHAATRPQAQHPLRLLTATLLLALTAAFVQNANAQPHDGPGGHDGPGMMGRDHGAGRMLDSVNATPAQRAQIRQIMQSARTDLKALHDSGRTLRTQMQSLFAQANVDANAAESLRQQMLALHDQESSRMLQARIAAAQVLTADQRKAIADRMTQMQALMQRQRAERAALGRPAQ